MKAAQVGAGYRAYRDGRTVARRLLAIDTDGKNQLQLVPEGRSRPGSDLIWNAVAQDRVVSWIKGDPKHILIQLARDDRIKSSVYKLNIYSNRMKRVQKFLPSVLRWYADDKGTLKFATGYRKLREPIAYFLTNGKRQKVEIQHLTGLNPPSFLDFAGDGTSAWVLSNNGKNTQGVHRVSLATGRVLDTLFEHKQYDVRRFLAHPKSGQPIMVSYEAAQEEFVWFDQTVETHVKAISSVLGKPEYIRIVSTDDHMNKMVVYTEGNGTHPAYYLYTFATQSIAKIAQWRQGEPAQFEHVTYEARDGVDIPAYVSLPGPKDKGPYPTVIRPHGGPWARANGRQYFITQFLLDRGYAVLKPNFRGSTGYGDRFIRMGFEEWGLKMQDDVIDGLNWMIKSGYTDPDRVCIAGGSYGGYVSLAAAYKTPDRFKCAISFAGVGDLEDLVSNWNRYRFGRLSTARIQQGQSLEANSPIKHVDEIGIPILIVHGDVDTTVGVEQSREFVNALREAGKPHRYIEQRNGDHYYSLQTHRIQYLEALKAFLGEHLE